MPFNDDLGDFPGTLYTYGESRVLRTDDMTIHIVRGADPSVQFRSENPAGRAPTSEWEERAESLRIDVDALGDGGALFLSEDRGRLTREECAILFAGLARSDKARVAVSLARHARRDGDHVVWDVDEMPKDDADFLMQCGLQFSMQRGFKQLAVVVGRDASISERVTAVSAAWGRDSSIRSGCLVPAAKPAAGSDARPCPIATDRVTPFSIVHPGGAPPNLAGDAFALSPLKPAFEMVQRWRGAPPPGVAQHVAAAARIALDPAGSAFRLRDVGEPWPAHAAPPTPAEPAAAAPGDSAFLQFVSRQPPGGTFVELPAEVAIPAAVAAPGCSLWAGDGVTPTRVLYAPPGWACKSTAFGTSIFDESGAERVMVRAGHPELPDAIKVYDPGAPLFL